MFPGQGMAEERGWLWKRLKEVLPVLLAAGMEASRMEDRTGSKIILRKLPKDDATDATQDEMRQDKPKTGGIKGEDDATSNATGGNAAGGNNAGSNATGNAR